MDQLTKEVPAKKSKEKLFELLINEDTFFPPKKESYIAVNGKNIAIKHGVKVIVREWVINALNESVIDEPIQVEEAEGGKVILEETNKRMRYSFSAMPWTGQQAE